MKNAQKLKYDYAQSMRILDFYVPILYAMGVEKYSVRFSDALGSFWDQYFPLNRPPRQFSVFDFFDKNANLILEMGCSLEVLGFRSSFWLMYGMN